MTVVDFEPNHVLAIVRQNPRRQNEGAIQYCQRIAVLAGLIRPEDTAGEPVGGWYDAGAVTETTNEREDYWNR